MSVTELTQSGIFSGRWNNTFVAGELFVIGRHNFKLINKSIKTNGNRKLPELRNVWISATNLVYSNFSNLGCTQAVISNAGVGPLNMFVPYFLKNGKYKIID